MRQNNGGDNLTEFLCAFGVVCLGLTVGLSCINDWWELTPCKYSDLKIDNHENNTFTMEVTLTRGKTSTRTTISTSIHDWDLFSTMRYELRASARSYSETPLVFPRLCYATCDIHDRIYRYPALSLQKIHRLPAIYIILILVLASPISGILAILILITVYTLRQ